MGLRNRAVKEARKMLNDDIDFQAVIEQLFNNRNDYNELFIKMNDDERFEEAQNIISEAS